MKKFLESFLLVLLPVLLFCSPALLVAAQLPVLANVAKQKPGISGANEKAAPGQKPVLGQRGNISPVKTIPDKSAVGDIRLPDVGKRISSRSAIIIDAETGETLYALSPDTPRQPASTIKVLTGMIALKSLDEDEWVGVSSRASGMPRSKVYLDPAKSYRANDLINAVLLASANDASVALAEKIAGSEEKFGEMMNLRARLWGAENTVCRTASGLTAKGQQSTARDLANIFRHAMQDEGFARRMGRAKLRTSYGKLLRNHNKALWTVKGAEGGKTGYTNAARQTYVGQFAGNQGKIIVAIMGSETMWADIENLVDYGLKKQEKLARLRSGGQGQEVASAR
ncbi:MAG: serine hydrolase [Desulfobulbaceae bacterium]|nr:serine hydrolase [Desulfobulbaceae bacterium]